MSGGVQGARGDAPPRRRLRGRREGALAWAPPVSAGWRARRELGRHEHVSVELKEPAERTAPGQFACLYAGDVIVGHGTVAG